MHALIFDEAENFLGVETLNHHMRSAEHGKEVRDAPAISVEERNGVQALRRLFRSVIPSRRAPRADRCSGA